MSAPQVEWSGLIFAAAIALCFLPSTVQLIKRRLREHADAELVTELQRVTAQRDRYHGLYNEAVQRNAILLGLNETPEDTPLFDRACLAWLDKSTEWDAS